MANNDTAFDNLLPRVRQNIAKAASRLKTASPEQQQRALQEALAVLERLPPGVQSMARDMIQREAARGVSPRGLGSAPVGAAAGAASSAATISAIIGTVGSLALTTWQITEQRKDAKDAKRRSEASLALEREIANEQLAAMRQQREAQARMVEQAEAAQAAQSEQAAAGGAAGGTNKTLLIAGGAAVAAVAAVALMK